MGKLRLTLYETSLVEGIRLLSYGLLGFFAVQLLLNGFQAHLVSWGETGAYLERPSSQWRWISLGQYGLFYLAYGFLWFWLRPLFSLNPPSQNTLVQAFLLAGVLLLLTYMVSMVFAVWGLHEVKTLELDKTIPGFWAVHTAQFALIGYVEEALFRGVFWQAWLLMGGSTSWFFFFSAATFALVHHYSWVGLTVVFVLGSALGLHYQTYRDFHAIALAHTFYNLTLVGLWYINGA